MRSRLTELKTGIRGARSAILSAPMDWQQRPKLARRWLASSRGRLVWDGSERAFDQRRLTSQPSDLTVCRFRLRGRRLSGNVVALLTSRAAIAARCAGRLLRI